MKSHSALWKKEISAQNLKLTNINNLLFYQSQWQTENKTNLYYVVYKIVVALLFFAIFILSVLDVNNLDQSAAFRAKWLIYLTNWQFLLQTVTVSVAAILVTSMYLKARKYEGQMQVFLVNKKLCPIYWALNTIAVNGSLFVCLVYWAMIYDEKLHSISLVNLFSHAINAMLLLIDCILVAHPLRLLHIYIPICFNSIYIVFSIVYYFCDGTDKFDKNYIYPILNWDKPWDALKNIFFVLILVIIVHVLTYFVVCLRQCLRPKAINKEEQTLNLTQSSLHLQRV